MSYKVQKNEKISDIVNKLDMPYDLIKRYNPFVESPNDFYEGRTLILPRVYTILPDQTYESISKAHSIHPSYLKELNPYMDGQSVVYWGQTIFLPPDTEMI
jgi:LysM repeat protein